MSPDLYNGNIKNTVTSISKFGDCDEINDRTTFNNAIRIEVNDGSAMPHMPTTINFLPELGEQKLELPCGSELVFNYDSANQEVLIVLQDCAGHIASNHYSITSSSTNTMNNTICNVTLSITAASVGVTQAMSSNFKPMAAVYTYDQLNRIKSANYNQEINLSTNQWTSSSLMNDYHNTYSYDPNGNIMTLFRNGNQCHSVLAMDDLTYHYYNNTNQLEYVGDAVGTSADYIGDIENQSTGNYGYDEIGNLIRDNKGHILNIEWTLYGKISKIQKDDDCTIGSVSETLEFEYDAMGNRASKHYTNTIKGIDQWEYYVRDANGNVMANYTYKTELLINCNSPSPILALRWSESPIYGSSRLGVYKPNKLLFRIEDQCAMTPVGDEEGIVYLPNQSFFEDVRGGKAYELSNHLGNVQVVISDKRLQVCTDGVLYFEADILSAQDYYPFGMVMPERSFASSTYRYGFNSQEKDDDVSGNANTNTAEFWEYDTRLGRRWNMDPKPDFSICNYTCFRDNPIKNFDIKGDWAVKVHYAITNGAMLKLGKASDVSDRIAHFSSTYADHPTQDVLDIFNKGERYKYREEYIKNGTYDKTKDSQKDDPEHEKWHSMMTDEEQRNGMTHEQAMLRGLGFGWGLILSSATTGSETDFGQGLHALQDAYAHGGASHSEHLSINWSTVKMFYNDMFGLTSQAEKITVSAIVLTDLMKGDKKSLEAAFKLGVTFDFTGMNGDQITNTIELFKKNGYELTELKSQKGLQYIAKQIKK